MPYRRNAPWRVDYLHGAGAFTAAKPVGTVGRAAGHRAPTSRRRETATPGPCGDACRRRRRFGGRRTRGKSRPRSSAGPPASTSQPCPRTNRAALSQPRRDTPVEQLVRARKARGRFVWSNGQWERARTGGAGSDGRRAPARRQNKWVVPPSASRNQYAADRRPAPRGRDGGHEGTERCPVAMVPPDSGAAPRAAAAAHTSAASSPADATARSPASNCVPAPRAPEAEPSPPDAPAASGASAMRVAARTFPPAASATERVPAPRASEAEPGPHDTPAASVSPTLRATARTFTPGQGELGGRVLATSSHKGGRR